MYCTAKLHLYEVCPEVTFICKLAVRCFFFTLFSTELDLNAKRVQRRNNICILYRIKAATTRPTNHRLSVVSEKEMTQEKREDSGSVSQLFEELSAVV